ncbi:MAG: hypothetical protein CMJ64_18325 [Planctomycetaceae bacterium]|jgi:hypothetical protein|nr:hypothetical protein [Planctomycetaceae bacterium]
MEYSDPLWANCPAGTFSDMVQTLRIARRQRWIAQIARPTAGLLLLVLLWVAFMIYNPVNDITCADVVDRFAEFRDKQLDSDLSDRLSFHLDKCPDCRRQYAMLVPVGSHHP